MQFQRDHCRGPIQCRQVARSIGDEPCEDQQQAEDDRDHQTASSPRHVLARHAGRLDRLLNVDGRDVIFAARGIRGIYQIVDDSVRTARVIADDTKNSGRFDEIAQAIAAQQQRVAGTERDFMQIDELGIVRCVRLRANIAKDFVAPGMAHRMMLGNLVRVLALTNRRMVTRDLFDATVADFVETRVANVTDRRRPVLDNRDCENAGHAPPLRASGGQAMNFVVGNSDRFANAFANRARLALEALAQHAQGDVGCSSAGSLSADAVDDDEQAARFVNVEAVLVDLTLKASIGGTGGRDRAERRHSPVQLRPVFNSQICPATTATSAMRKT